MDSDFSSIRDLLFGPKTDPSTSGSNAIPLGARSRLPDTTPDVPTTKVDGDDDDKEERKTDEDDYDTIVHQLAFDKRAKPTDRTKTEEELALEEAERLQKQEKDRLRRMKGGNVTGSDDDDDGGDGDGVKGRGRKKGKGRVPEADDLDDDFELDEDAGMLGPGLEDEVSVDGTEEGSESGSGSGEDGGSEISEVGEDEAKEESEADSDDHEPTTLLSSAKSPKSKSKSSSSTASKYKKGDELPFVFPCPPTHEELLEIIENIDTSDVPTVISRIRTTHHPSLGEDNKTKLQVSLRSACYFDKSLINSCRRLYALFSSTTSSTSHPHTHPPYPSPPP